MDYNYKSISQSKNQTEEPKQETIRAEREMQRIVQEPFVEKVIKSLEEQRRKRRKSHSIYTQKYVAEQVGISLSTYKGYVRGDSYHIDLITAKGIADVLGCRLSDVIKNAEK